MTIAWPLVIQRFQTWLYIGPLGHLYSVVVDLGVFFVKSVAGRAQRRLSGAARRPRARR